MKPNRALQAGYTLLEVLVAFVILAMALTVLFRIFAAGLNNVGAASDYTQAVMVGEAKIEALGQDVVLHPSQTEGIESDKFHWTRTISEFSLPSADGASRATIAAYRVHVAVEWPTGRNARRIELATIRLDDSAHRAGTRR